MQKTLCTYCPKQISLIETFLCIVNIMYFSNVTMYQFISTQIDPKIPNYACDFLYKYTMNLMKY